MGVDYLVGEDPLNLPISKEYICKSEVTATLLKLLEELDEVKTPKELYHVLEIHAKHDSFWEVIDASEWSSTEVITIANNGCLMHELIFNDLVRWRKEQLDSLSKRLEVFGIFVAFEKASESS